MEVAEAYAPAHITGLFQICDKPADPLQKGSKGAGVCLKLGVKTRVALEKASENSIEIWINGQKQNAAKVSETVVNEFLARTMEKFAVKIEHTVEVPVGAGFGSSGAAALSLALALNEALRLGLTPIQAAQIAHVAEVKCKTGLGTVIAEFFGGLEIRTIPGAPGIGEVHRIPAADEYQAVCLSFGSLSTAKALADMELRRRINEHGAELLNVLVETPTVENFLKLSRRFAEHTGLITSRVRKVLDAADVLGVVCSMPMFGEAVFSIVKPEKVEVLLEVFRKNHVGGEVFTSEIGFEGARLL